MKGAPQDIAGNNDTLDTTGRAYFGEHLFGKNMQRTQSYLLYQHIKRLNQIRKAIPALQSGHMSHVAEWDSGMRFVRDTGNSYAVIGRSMGSGQNVSVGNIRNGRYTDVVTGNSVNVSKGNLSFHVKPNSAGIYVLNGHGKVGIDGVYLK